MANPDKLLAAEIRKAIRDLSGLLSGGGGIMFRLEQAEQKAAANPRKRTLDLMNLNSGLGQDEIARRLRAINEGLTLAADSVRTDPVATDAA